MNDRTLTKLRLLSLTSLLALAAAPLALAQSAPASTTTSTSTDTETEDSTIKLSPFEVNSAKDRGYVATNTLGGTRINSELRDVGSAISVITGQFLQDTGATNNSSLLQYTANTEVGGVSGNFGGVGNGTQQSERTVLLRPNSNTRVRGLDAADNTRDFFLTSIPWDSYNVDRVDIQRGANAMLFGVGSPAGIINTNLVPAKFTDSTKFENRVGSYGSLRNSVDLNFGLIKKQLGLRITAVDDDAKFRQKPAFDHSQRVFAALRYDPAFLNTDLVRTSLKANFENGHVASNRARELPPIDAISPWFLTGAGTLNHQTYDPNVAWSNNGGVAKTGSPNYIAWFNNAHFGQAYGADLNLLYNQDNATPLKIYSPFASTYHGIYSKGDAFNAVFGNYTGQIPGLPYSQTVGIATFSSYATGSNLPGAQFGLWHDKSLTDTSIYDFYNHLIDGNNKQEWQRWKTLNLDFNQSFFGNRFSYDIAFNHETYTDGQESFLDGQQYQISVDINSKLMDGTANPNAGRPYVSGKGQYGNGMSFINRDALHLTATGELRSTDFLRKDSFLATLLGRHQFTALYSWDKKEQEDRSFARWSLDPSWGATIGDTAPTLTNRIRQVDYAIYLGKSLTTATSAAGSQLQPITFDATPASNYTISYFNSNWNKPTNPSDAGYVDPNAAFTYYDPLTNVGSDSSQAGNPANYVGWTTGQVKVLNADKGDINQLYLAGAKNQVVVKSFAGNWQGFLWAKNVVATYGLRHDTLLHRSANAPYASGGLQNVTTDYTYDDSKPNTRVQYSNNTSLWSLVLHSPKQLKQYLPEGLDISLFYNHSNNWNAQDTRVDIEGNPIANATGRTKDYGILISALDEKVSFKINWYKTNVKNATLQGDGAGLGSSGISSMINTQMWLAGNAVILARGMYQGKGQPWGWDYAWNDAKTGYGANPREAAGAAIDKLETDAIKAVIAQLPSQAWFDGYGVNFNVANMKSGNYDAAITGTTAAYLDSQGNSGNIMNAANNGTINGVAPVATSDNTSTGVEFELTAQPLKNLNFAVNASQTDATRTNLSATLTSFIMKQKATMDSAAGDIRQWWAGDQTLRKVWTGSVWGPYQNLLAQNGSTAAEIRPWRFNGVASYYFDRGTLKGVNVGAAYRWQQGSILGYALQSTTEADKQIPDVTKPFHGPSEQTADLWLGYEHKLTAKLNWKIQLNLRNVAKKAHLIPISVQPDGSPAQYRIGDGMGWTITNTFSF